MALPPGPTPTPDSPSGSFGPGGVNASRGLAVNGIMSSYTAEVFAAANPPGTPTVPGKLPVPPGMRRHVDEVAEGHADAVREIIRIWPDLREAITSGTFPDPPPQNNGDGNNEVVQLIARYVDP